MKGPVLMAVAVLLGMAISLPGGDVRAEGTGGAAAVPKAAAAGPKARLAAVFTGLRSDAGKVRISLYKGPQGYPRDTKFAHRMMAASIQGGRATVVFEDLEPGEYAVSAFHDEDSDKKLGRSFIGIPVEGIAASNDARNPVGPPKYKDARFVLGDGESEIRMTMRY